MEIILRVVVFLFGLLNLGMGFAELVDPGLGRSEGAPPSRLEVLPKVAVFLVYGGTIVGSSMTLPKMVTLPAIFVLAAGAIFHLGSFIFKLLGHLREYFFDGPYSGYLLYMLPPFLLIVLPAFGAVFLAWRQRAHWNVKVNTLQE